MLECERNNCIELHQKLNSTNEELLQLKKEKEVSNQNYSEALDKVKEFKALHQQSEEKNEENGGEVDLELISMKASVSQVENVLKKMNEEIQMSKSALKKQAMEMDALKTRIVELEKVG